MYLKNTTKINIIFWFKELENEKLFSCVTFKK